jgi:hypothetical protein
MSAILYIPILYIGSGIIIGAILGWLYGKIKKPLR